MILVFPVTVFAAGNIQLNPMTSSGGSGSIQLNPMTSSDSAEISPGSGRIIIRPMISAGSRWDSNFYKDTDNERSVYSHTIRPGFTLGYETARSKIALTYTLDATLYNKDADDFLGHTASLSAETKPFSRLTLKVEDSFYKTRDSSYAGEFSSTSGNEKYFINRLNPKILYDFGEKFSAGLGYQNTLTNYDGDSEDSIEHKGTFDLRYNLTPTANVALQYARWKRDYDEESSDYISDQLGLTFAKQFKYTAFQAGAGYHKRHFGDPELEDMDTFFYRLGISRQNSPGNTISFQASQNFNDSASSDAYFTATQFSLRMAQMFRRRILATVETRYKTDDYESGYEGRKDDTYSIIAGLGYTMNQWMTLSLGAGYEERNSNWDEYDYSNKFITGNIDFHYDPAGSRAY